MGVEDEELHRLMQLLMHWNCWASRDRTRCCKHCLVTGRPKCLLTDLRHLLQPHQGPRRSRAWSAVSGTSLLAAQLCGAPSLIWRTALPRSQSTLLQFGLDVLGTYHCRDEHAIFGRPTCLHRNVACGRLHRGTSHRPRPPSDLQKFVQCEIISQPYPSETCFLEMR